MESNLIVTADQTAEAVERHDCPTCAASAGSACRARAGRTAAKYHTARFTLVPALRDDLHVAVPADRNPGRPWVQGPPVAPTQTEGTHQAIRIGYARTSTARQELASQLGALPVRCATRAYPPGHTSVYLMGPGSGLPGKGPSASK